MKAKSTIQKQMQRLWKTCQDPKADQYLRCECYEAYHALQWVIEDTSWTPAGEAEKRLKESP